MFKLLIVDDEQLTRYFLKNTIETLTDQWEVVGMAVEGTEALEILETENVDLIITDIKMPVMDGLELCKIVSNKYPHIHLVILSGYGEFNYAKNAIEYNVNDYLLKPIVNKELEQMLNKMADICEQDKITTEKHTMLLSTSMKYKEEIIEKFLKALITNSHAQITSLHPILYNLNISLIEEECMISILHIREDTLIRRNMPLTNIPLLKLFLYNTTKKALNNRDIKVFFDSNENTVLCIPVNENENVLQIISNIYTNINSDFFLETGLTIYCTVGSKKNDLFQLKDSYEEAHISLIHHLLLDTSQSPIYIYDENKYIEETIKLKSLTTSLIYTIHNKDEINIRLIAQDLSQYIYNKIAPDCTIQYIYLLTCQLEASLLNNQDCLSIYKLFHDISISNKNNLNQFIMTLINAFIDLTLSKAPHEDDANLLVKKSKQYIYDHYMEPISLSLIADQLSISSSYLSNLFHESEGISYIKFLTEVRLKHASSLLRSNPDLKLESIAKQVGYISVKHFSYVFKKYYNESPGEYRKKNSKE